MAAADLPSSGIAQTLAGAGRVLALPTVTQGLAGVDVDELGSAPYTIAIVDGYWAPGDGGGGILQWTPASTAEPDGFLVFAPSRRRAGPATGRWLRIVEPARLTFEMAGAKGDGKTNDFPACQHLLVRAKQRFHGCRVQLQPGRSYLIDYNNGGVQSFNVRLRHPKAGALVIPSHCVVEGPGGALGITARGVPELQIASRIVLHPQMTVFLSYFAELADLQIVRKTMGEPVDNFEPSGPADLEQMQAQIDLWFSESGENTAVNGGVRSVAITNGGPDTKVRRVLALGFNTAYVSDGFGRPVVSELYFDTAATGVEITRSADDALVEGCYSNAFWSSNIAPQRNEKGDHAARPGIGFHFHDKTDGLRCVDCSAIGWAVGFRLANVWSVTVVNPNAEPARQPTGSVTHGILTEDSVSHTTIINPLVDGYTFKIDFQHRPFSKTTPTGPNGRPGLGQYATASVTLIGGSVQSNPRLDAPGSRAIRLGPYSSGMVTDVNLAGALLAPAILAQAHVGIWKFIGLNPSGGMYQPMFEFETPADSRNILRFGCDPIDGSAPAQWTMSGPLVLTDLPRSPAGLPPGALWRKGDTLRIV